jgi:hypothetical protein
MKTLTTFCIMILTATVIRAEDILPSQIVDDSREAIWRLADGSTYQDVRIEEKTSGPWVRISYEASHTDTAPAPRSVWVIPKKATSGSKEAESKPRFGVWINLSQVCSIGFIAPEQ